VHELRNWVHVESETKSENKTVAQESKVAQDRRDARKQHQSTIAANALTAIAGETKQQTLQRKASVQKNVTKTLLGATIKWTFKFDSSINIQEIEDVVATQGDGGATGELVDACDGEVGTISIYSHVDQKFNTNQDLLIGTTIIKATQLSAVDFSELANKIIFETNTLIVTKDSKHVCRRLANILNANPDIRIRVDGHVKLNKRVGTRVRMHPAKIGQAERLSRLRAMSVRDKIAEYGVDADRMEYKGCTTGDDKKVEIHVL